MLSVQAMRRRDDEGLHRYLIEHRGEVLAVGDGEGGLHLRQRVAAEAADAHQFRVWASL
jgi:hypothetical protein